MSFFPNIEDDKFPFDTCLETLAVNWFGADKLFEFCIVKDNQSWICSYAVLTYLTDVYISMMKDQIEFELFQMGQKYSF